MVKAKTQLYGICGVDEAGRGPMIGPMVICGVVINPDSIQDLEKIGTRDSKILSPSRRIALGKKIEKLAISTRFRSISASDIDKRRKHTTLNEIEVEEFVSILRQLKPKTIYLDAADVKAERFGKVIGEKSGLSVKGAVIISEHKADSKYPIVSAASILAKVERDRVINRLHEKYGDFGSGYPSDPKTVEFVRDLVRSNKKLPTIIRKSWDSVRKIIDDESTRQTALDSF